jgi:hypothetical protein
MENYPKKRIICVMQPRELSPEGQQLTAGLEVAAAHRPSKPVDPIHISGVGERLYFAYEQLRNAAEYGERHLLIRRSIERFLRRNLRLGDGIYEDFGVELVSEMTHARYLKNDTVAREKVGSIMAIAERYSKLAVEVRKAHADIPREQLATWMYQAASVEIEHQLVPHAETDAYIDFAHRHYEQHIDRDSLPEVEDSVYTIALYCAVHRSLFKSDVATIRYYALAARLGAGRESSLNYFVGLNQRIDELYQAPITNRIARLVNRYGATLRILREVLIDTQEPQKLLPQSSELLSRVVTECEVQYKQMRKRLNDGIIRSVLFIFITKMLIGLSIEVPYDLLTINTISWLPLLINLIFPPVYMATIGLGVRTPGKRNTEVIESYLSRILYRSDDPALRYRIKKRVSSPTLTTAFNLVYGVAFLISFSILVYILHLLGFNLVNGVIFFVFLSAVSFFGFRLSQTAQELDIVSPRRSLIGVLFDFFYTPFIRVGQWLSDKYSRLNVVTFILDMAIELPLKTSLRIVQQWTGFIRDKQEEL